MTEPGGEAHLLRIRARSVLLLVAAIGAALVVRNLFGKSARVLGWFVAAAVVAALLLPAVNLLARWMRRGFALLIVVLLTVGGVGYVGYVIVDDVRHQIQRLQRVAPEAAQSIESSQRYGHIARDFHLRERVESFVNQLPSRFAGGHGAQAIRSATTRGLAYLAGTVLTVFLLLHGPRLVDGALRQIRDPIKRVRAENVLAFAYRRAWTHLVGVVAIALATGLYTYAWCRIAGLPGAGVLGIYVGLCSIVPFVGVLVGSIPVVLLAAGLKPGWWAALLVAAFVLWQALDVDVLRRHLNIRSIAIGPSITILVALFGIDLYGLGGALVGFALVVFAAALLDELAPTDRDTIDLGPITG